MLIGETHRRPHLHQLTPPWPAEPTSPSTNYATLLSSLRRNLLPSEENSGEIDYIPAEDDDEFFMYEFKVRMCTRARAHDWTECPFAHPGEKARRRDPRKYNYSGNSCSDFRKGVCKKGDSCEFAHGVFESWLHPSKYRTQPCKDGSGCSRRVCFFAHSPDKLRAGSGPSPELLFDDHDHEVGELVEDLRRSLQLSKVKSLPKWFGSPPAGKPALVRAGFCSLPTTPTRPRVGYLEMWKKYYKKKDLPQGEGEEVVMERVESGREVRARMFEKLSKENSFNGSGFKSDQVEPSGSGPDFGWVSDLITQIE